MEEQKTEEVQPQVINAPVPEDKASGLAITSMILGIAAIVCSWIIGLNFALGVAALVTGIIELKKINSGQSNPKGKGMALTGIILGALAIVAAIIYVIVIAVTVTTAAGWLPIFMQNLQMYQ